MGNCCLALFPDGDYHGSDFYVYKEARARKVHVCGECGYEIFPGDEYAREADWFEGVYTGNITCACCIAVRHALVCPSYWSSCGGFMWVYLEEVLGYDLHAEFSWCKIAELQPIPRARVLLMIEELWEGQDCEAL